jgi:hypothetical protein
MTISTEAKTCDMKAEFSAGIFNFSICLMALIALYIDMFSPEGEMRFGVFKSSLFNPSPILGRVARGTFLLCELSFM